MSYSCNVVQIQYSELKAHFYFCFKLRYIKRFFNAFIFFYIYVFDYLIRLDALYRYCTGAYAR